MSQFLYFGQKLRGSGGVRITTSKPNNSSSSRSRVNKFKNSTTTSTTTASTSTFTTTTSSPTTTSIATTASRSATITPTARARGGSSNNNNNNNHNINGGKELEMEQSALAVRVSSTGATGLRNQAHQHYLHHYRLQNKTRKMPPSSDSRLKNILRAQAATNDSNYQDEDIVTNKLPVTTTTPAKKLTQLDPSEIQKLYRQNKISTTVAPKRSRNLENEVLLPITSMFDNGTSSNGSTTASTTVMSTTTTTTTTSTVNSVTDSSSLSNYSVSDNINISDNYVSTSTALPRVTSLIASTPAGNRSSSGSTSGRSSEGSTVSTSSAGVYVTSVFGDVYDGSNHYQQQFEQRRLINVSEVVSRRHDSDALASQESFLLVYYILATCVLFPIALGIVVILKRLIIRKRKVSLAY